MFLTPRQVKQLTGIPNSDPQAQIRNLDERGIRHMGINAAGRVIVPCSVVDGGNTAPMPPKPWQPDFSKMGA